jgi:hypothetical protein
MKGLLLPLLAPPTLVLAAAPALAVEGKARRASFFASWGPLLRHTTHDR